MSSVALSIKSKPVVTKSVLVATDFSETSVKAMRHALAIARRFDAKVYFAHLVNSLGFTLAGPSAVVAATEAAYRDAQALESHLLKAGLLSGLRYEFIVGTGPVWDALDHVIRDKKIDLIVNGTHGRRGLPKLLLGSVAEQIFRYAECSVFTVGPISYNETRVDDERNDRTYLFPTDFGEHSLNALPSAVALANQFGAKLVLLHVLHSTPSRQSLLYTANLRTLEELTLGMDLAVRPESVVEFCPTGPTSGKILETAEKVKADLIIMGLRRYKHAGAASHAPWATAYEIVCGAGCPVLTARG